MSRRPSETYEKMSSSQKTTTNLEKNCNQIFAKGPTILTRELFEKMKKTDLGNKTTRIFGYEIETKQLWVLAGLVLLCILSFTGTILMFFTNTFDNVVFSQLAIRENTQSYEMWKKPTPRPFLKVHIFNYTNVHDFENHKADKLNVADIGPYIYEMSLERVNAKFNANLITYQEHRVYKFMPDLSFPLKQNDQIVAPNMPMLTIAALSKHSNYFARLGVSGIFNGLDATPFVNMAAERFIIGYEDNLYSLSKSLLKLQNQKPYERFGLVSSSLGLAQEVFTINSGSNNIDDIARFEEVDGRTKLPHWSTEECNQLSDATDGTLFSPKQVRNKRPLSLYMKEMCRTLPLHFQKEVKILNGKIPAYRYAVPGSIFDTPEKTPSNQCFCNLDSGECPPQGVFNTTPCAFGAPAYLSFPHFHFGDPELIQGVTGLSPESVPYESYVDVHPTLGFVMSGKNRFQLNIQVVKSFGIKQLDKYEDGVMLPVAWFEISLEDKTLPDDIIGLIFQTTFTLKSVELALKYGCLLTALVTCVFIGIVARNKWVGRERTSSIRPLHV